MKVVHRLAIGTVGDVCPVNFDMAPAIVKTEAVQPSVYPQGTEIALRRAAVVSAGGTVTADLVALRV